LPCIRRTTWPDIRSIAGIGRNGLRVEGVMVLCVLL
jgi:hypothetical protein